MARQRQARGPCLRGQRFSPVTGGKSSSAVEQFDQANAYNYCCIKKMTGLELL